MILTLLIFIAAILYSSVGHAGASSYLAAMALLSVPTEVMKPTALVLNIIVGTIATGRFYRAGYFSFCLFWPFAVTSVPFAMLGSAIDLPHQFYRAGVGAVILFGATRLIRSSRQKEPAATKPMPLAAALIVGAVIGLLAGLTGTGGGIFLSPLLVLAGWADVRQSSGVSAPFVLVNSLAGLLGAPRSLYDVPPEIVFLAVAAALGGIIGSELGSRRLPPHTLRSLLGCLLIIAGLKLIFW